MNVRLLDLSILAQGSFPAGLLHRPAIQAASRHLPPSLAPHVVAALHRPGSAGGGAGPVLRPPDPRVAVLPWPRSFQPSMGRGRELPAMVRDPAERFFDRDLSAIRTYQSLELRQLGARALTAGSHMVFAPGAFDPHTVQGKLLLAHELTHAVQQRSGRVRGPAAAGLVLVRDPLLDAEAAARAQGFLNKGQRAILQAKPGGVIQRKTGDWYNNGVLSVQELWRDEQLFLNAGDGNFARFDFQIYGGNDLTIKHIDALNFRAGTGVAYLGLQLLAQYAQSHRCDRISLGTPVVKKDPSSVDAKTADSADFKGSQAAAHIYEKVGFDVSSAMAASHSIVTPAQMERIAGREVLAKRWVGGRLGGPSASASTDRSRLLDSRPHSDASSTGCCSSCYLTTACVRHRGLDLDGEELTVLRRLRDGHMGATAERRRQRQRYYDYAPRIVAAIDSSPERDPIYDWIHGAVRLSVDRIRDGHPGEAERIYTQAVLALERALLEA